MKFNGSLPQKATDIEPMPPHLDPSDPPIPPSTQRTRWRIALAALLAFVSYKAFSTPSATVSFLHMDKVLHVCAFVCLTFVASRSWPPGRQTNWSVALGLAIYGAFIEWVQSQLPLREASLADWAADALGIALGLALFHGLRVVTARPAAEPKPTFRGSSRHELPSPDTVLMQRASCPVEPGETDEPGPA